MSVPAPVAAHHHAFDPVRTPQCLGRRNHIAGVDTGPDVRRGERDGLGVVVFGNQRHRFHCEAESRTGTAQGVDGARGLLAEGEVLPDHDFHDVQVLDE